ncbi:MAG TPA: RodZ domain-containing protein [Candidatus Acidoferrales bacterium]
MSSTHFGEHLKREREMRGVSLEEISLATRIAPRFLAALESEQWEKLPGGVFNRGFIRSVAHYLGLDEDSMVAEYALHTKGRPEPGVVADPPDKPESQWRQITLVVIFAIIVIAVSWFAIQYLVPRVTAYMRKRAATTSNLTREAGGASQGVLNSLPANPAVAANSDPSSVLAANAGAPTSLAVRLQAARDADITIVADGKPSFSGRMNAGDVKQFAAVDSIQIISSEASALLVDLNGQSVTLPGQPAQPSSLTLTQKDLKNAGGASH